MPPSTSSGSDVDTLAIDIGGTGLKASVLDASGAMEHDRVRVDTPYPLSPQRLLQELEKLIAQLPPFDRVSAGFPGMVRAGRILSAPHFVSPDGPGGTPALKLARAWERFDLAGALEQMTGKPTKVANDADVQGAAVIKGEGFEAVVTLGTGVGTAFFLDGQLEPHLEFAHHPLAKGKTYNEVIGDAARKKSGNKKWRKQALEAIETLRALTFFDHCYVGGGNSTRLGSDLPPNVTVVDNSAGILGGIKLWDVTRGHAGETANMRHERQGPPTRGAPAKAVPARATTTKATPAQNANPAEKAAPAKRTGAATGARIGVSKAPPRVTVVETPAAPPAPVRRATPRGAAAPRPRPSATS